MHAFHQNIWKPDLNIFWIQFLLTNKNNKTDMYLPVLTDCSLYSDRKHSWFELKLIQNEWIDVVVDDDDGKQLTTVKSGSMCTTCYLIWEIFFPNRDEWCIQCTYMYENWSSLLYTTNDESNLLYFLVIFGIIYLVLGNMQAKQIFLFFWEASYASYFLVFPHHHHQYQCYSFSVIISCMCTSSIRNYDSSVIIFPCISLTYMRECLRIIVITEQLWLLLLCSNSK